MMLTNAQIYTLRRLSGGSKYQLRGDGKKARECRPGSGIFTDDISAPSIPVLFRLGLVDYVHKGGERTRLVLCGYAYRHGETRRCHHEYQGLIFHNNFVSSKEKQRVLNV